MVFGEIYSIYYFFIQVYLQIHLNKIIVHPDSHISQGRSGLPCEFDADLW